MARVQQAAARIFAGAFAAAFVVPLVASTPAWSSACNQEVVARIRFPVGATCWAYRGAATTFVGNFAGGQTVVVKMTGEASEFNPQTNGVTTSWQPRTPDVEGPGGFSASAGENNVLAFRTLVAGAYRIGFSPCAMWGGQGQVAICAR